LYLSIYLLYLKTFIAHFPRVSSELSALHSHSHYWLCYLDNTRVMARQAWCQSVISSFIQSGFVLQSQPRHSPCRGSRMTVARFK
jgi:hypothetical protein